MPVSDAKPDGWIRTWSLNDGGMTKGLALAPELLKEDVLPKVPLSGIERPGPISESLPCSSSDTEPPSGASKAVMYLPEVPEHADPIDSLHAATLEMGSLGGSVPSLVLSPRESLPVWSIAPKAAPGGVDGNALVPPKLIAERALCGEHPSSDITSKDRKSVV